MAKAKSTVATFTRATVTGQFDPRAHHERADLVIVGRNQRSEPRQRVGIARDLGVYSSEGFSEGALFAAIAQLIRS